MTSYREAELKHGRQAMAACLHWFVTPTFHPLAKDCHISHPEDPIKSLQELPPAGAFQVTTGWWTSPPVDTNRARNPSVACL